MKTIHKFQIPIQDDFVLDLPLNAEVLCVQMQRDVPCVWVLLDTKDLATIARRFRIIGTGNPISDDEKLRHVGTFQTEGERFVWHLFEDVG